MENTPPSFLPSNWWPVCEPEPPLSVEPAASQAHNRLSGDQQRPAENLREPQRPEENQQRPAETRGEPAETSRDQQRTSKTRGEPQRPAETRGEPQRPAENLGELWRTSRFQYRRAELTSMELYCFALAVAG